MRRRLIAFDLDGTLAVTKSPISAVMALRLSELLDVYEVCVISGGNFDQFRTQVIDRLDAATDQLAKLHIMPTSGTRYLRFDSSKSAWITQYAENLPPATRDEIVRVLTKSAKELGYWEPDPFGMIIEDRGSQVTFSALGQNAPPDKKYAWDPDGTKKAAIRDRSAALLPDLEVHAGGTTSVDVTMSGVDKAYGMRKLLNALNLERQEVLFFGDKLKKGGNDYPVKALGIDCISVERWEETAVAIESIVRVFHATEGAVE